MSIIHLLPDVSWKIISLAPTYDCINIANNLHQTPLHLAVATRQLLVARRLVVAGAALDAPDHCGNTPLHIACREGLEDMVQFLLTPVQYNETMANRFEIPLQRIPQDLSIRNYDGEFFLGGHAWLAVSQICTEVSLSLFTHTHTLTRPHHTIVFMAYYVF